MAFIPRIFIHLSVVVFGFWLAHQNGLFESFSSSSNSGRRRVRGAVNDVDAKTAIENKMIQRGPQVLAKPCAEEQKRCFIVYDRAYRNRDGFGVMRMIGAKEMEGYVLTIVDLQLPQELTESNTKSTANWPVNKLVVPSVYIRLQIAAGFITESLSFAPKNEQKILTIGLGGGVATNFLSMLDWLKIESTVVEIDPFTAQLARKYFDHNDETRTNLVIDDGLKYLEESATKGEKFDVIMLDACYGDIKEDLICPILPFFKDKNIRNVYDSLTVTGTVTTNVISHSNSEKYENDLKAAFLKHFPSCSLVMFDKTTKRKQLICSKKINWTWEEQKHRFLQNLAEVDEIFDFRLTNIIS